MKLLRSVAAVVLGYIVFAMSAVLLFQVLHADPHAPQSLAFMTGTAVYGIAFAFLGGLLAARVAPGWPVQHAGLVCLVIAAGAIASLLASPAGDATWSQWTALLVMAPSAALAPLVTRIR